MKKKYILWAILTIVSIVLFASSAVLVSYFNNLWWIIIFTAIMFVVSFCFTCYYYFPNAEFICPKCKTQFKPTNFKSIMAMHTIKKRYLRCPKCNEIHWCKEKFVEKEHTN